RPTAAESHSTHPDDAVVAGPRSGLLEHAAERAQRACGRTHVLAMLQIPDATLAVGERREQQRAVRDRLVAGHTDDGQRHSSSPSRKGTSTCMPSYATTLAGKIARASRSSWRGSSAYRADRWVSTSRSARALRASAAASLAVA